MNKKCSYNVCFAPVVNVTMENIADPKHPTDEEIKDITRKAAWALVEESEEYINTANLKSVTLYEENIKEGPLSSPVPIIGQKSLHVATVIERNGNGDTGACILSSLTAQGIFDEVLRYLLNEENERELDFNFDEDALKLALSVGNEHNGPFYIECENRDTEFLVSAKVIK